MVKLLTLILGVMLLVPAWSLAADPLLSGYGGPGGGEQVVLGSTLVGRGGGGGPGGSSASAATDPYQESLDATAAAKGTGGSGSANAPEPSRSSASAKRTGARAILGRRPAMTRAPGAPAVRAYPSHASDVGGFPLSGGDVLLLTLAIAALIVLGAGLRRLGTPTPDDLLIPQDPAR